jgi:DNA (cytosine-5)-methyltransferase 1
MVARIQSFPDYWVFTGGKTWAYRQVGNAFPPQVAKCVGDSIAAALSRRRAAANGANRSNGSNGRPVELRLLDAPRHPYRVAKQFRPKPR